MQDFCVRGGKNIFNFRNKQNLSQKELASIVCISESCLHNLESGKSTTKMAVYYKISKALNISLRQLIHESIE